MNLPRHASASTRSRRRPARLVSAGCALGALPLAALALGGGAADASSAPTPLHYFQKESVLTFTNASGTVIQGYPPVGGHVREDDVDSVGSHSHHAKQWSVSDDLYCTVCARTRERRLLLRVRHRRFADLFGQRQRQPGR